MSPYRDIKKRAVVRTIWMVRVDEESPPIRNLLGAVMAADIRESGDAPSLLGAAALLSDLPARGLVRGQVAAIVETLDDATVLVEFSDDKGRAYAITPCSREALLALRTMPRAA